jgi:putative flippase GtrA
LLAIKYSFFALIATAVNLLTQWLCFLPFGKMDGALYGAMAAGTLTGLVTKYGLDKRWIFYYTSRDKRDDMARFGMYSLMGVFTTGIFWGTEMGFFYVFEFAGAHYVGGALGLAVGYAVKYLLDRKYVFKVSS